VIIGVCGLAGSGKDTVADILVKNHGFVKIAFADPMKRFCKEMFDFSDEQLWGSSDARNAPDKRYVRTHEEQLFQVDSFGKMARHREPLYLTPRHALQTLGTEWGRGCYSDVWAEYAIRVARELLKGGALYRPEEWYSVQPKMDLRGITPKGVVISDVRFKNEIAAIKRAGGKVIKVVRGEGLQGAAGQHLSETEQQELDDTFFDVTIQNDGCLDDLQRAVKDIETMLFLMSVVKS